MSIKDIIRTHTSSVHTALTRQLRYGVSFVSHFDIMLFIVIVKTQSRRRFVPDDEISGSKHFVNPSDETTSYQFFGHDLIVARVWSLRRSNGNLERHCCYVRLTDDQ